MAALRARSPLRRLRLGAHGGFSLVEVLVTITVLSVGVLGTVALIDGASATTSDTKGREAATALSRELIELTRSIKYADLSPPAIESALKTRPELVDSSSAAGYTISRRGFTFTVTVTACSVDDAKDALGAHSGGVNYCPESAATGTQDRNPDDYRRVTIALTWGQAGSTETARQTALVTNPAGGLGPSVKNLRITNPASATITTNEPSASFALDTSATPQSVEWYVNGSAQGLATGGGTTYTFAWNLSSVLDGTYLVQARAFNAEGRSGVTGVLTVILNRNAPLAPASFEGGRNLAGSHVDLEWLANREGDVVGYRVYRSDSSGNAVARACPPVAAGADALLQGATSCVDEAAPSGQVHYYAVALDRDPGGALREGAKTPTLAIAEGNTRPASPTALVACSGGDPGCNAPDGQPAPSGTTVLSWNSASDPDGDLISFYRIYRDGSSYAARRDRLYPPGGALVWIDTDTGGTQHEYRVSAVDAKFGESALAGPVTR